MLQADSVYYFDVSVPVPLPILLGYLDDQAK